MQKVKSPLLLWAGFIALCLYLLVTMSGSYRERSVAITSPQTEPRFQSEKLLASDTFDRVANGYPAAESMPAAESYSPLINTDQKPRMPDREPVEIDQQVDYAVGYIDEIQGSLLDSKPSVRLQAVQILADINHADSLSLLISALEDPQVSIRLAAIEALLLQRDNIISIYLEPLLYDPEKSVQLAAIDAIGALESNQSLYALTGLLSDHDADIRLAAVIALGEIGDRQAALYLQHQLFDPDYRVRQNVQAIMQELSE